MKRRKFLEWFVRVNSILIAGLISLPLVRFLFANDSLSRNENWYPALNLEHDMYQEGVTQASIRKVFRDGWRADVVEEYVWIVKKPDGNFLAFNSHCTHLGCLVSWNQESNLFLCPCHGGKFDSSGNRVAGPPPRPLDRYDTKIENNTLLIKL